MVLLPNIFVHCHGRCNRSFDHSPNLEYHYDKCIFFSFLFFFFSFVLFSFIFVSGKFSKNNGTGQCFGRNVEVEENETVEIIRISYHSFILVVALICAFFVFSLGFFFNIF